MFLLAFYKQILYFYILMTEKNTDIIHVSQTGNELAELNTNLAILKEIISSDNPTIGNMSQAVMIYSLAQEYNAPIGTVLRNVSLVKNKLVISYHMYKARVLSLAKIISFEHVDDYVPVYLYIDSDNIQYQEADLPKHFTIVPFSKIKGIPPAGQKFVCVVPEISNGKKTGKPMIVDHKSTYKFKRRIADIDHPDKTKIIEHTETFYYSDAIREGLVKDGGAWVKTPRVMTNKMAFVRGVPHVASDITQGTYTDIEFGVNLKENPPLDEE